MIGQVPMVTLWGVLIGPIILALIFLPPDLAVTCRRLHDIGRSGWWSLIIVLPILMDLIVETQDDPRDYRMLSAVPVIVLLLFLLRKGTDGPNRFGPPPDTGLSDD